MTRCGEHRVLSVVTQLESGGAQTVAVELHREFGRRGVPSTLAFLYEKDSTVFPRRDYETMLGHAPAGPADLLRIVARLRALWTMVRPTAVIAHTHFSNTICAAVAKTVPSRARVVAVHHNVFESYPASAKLFDRIAGRLGLYGFQVSVSRPVLGSLPDGGAGPRHAVILNAQSLAGSTMSRAAARQAFGLAADAFLIGNIGRLAEQKNQRFLIELLPRIPDAQVAILGEGPLRQSLVDRAAELGVLDRLRLLGTVVHERVPDFLQALDVLAMPSLHEGMSIAMLEALAAGVPFVGSDVPTISEVVRGGSGGGGAGVVLPLDPARWVAALTELRRADARADLATRERARARDFSVETMADQYLAAAKASR